MRVSGGCLCGAVRFEAEGEPFQETFCHCTICRRASGASPVAWVTFPADGFRYTRGAAKTFRSSDHGHRFFCGDCGSPLYVQVSTRPDLVGLRVGTLDDPSGFRAEADIFVKSAQPWDYMNPALPKYDTYPPGKSY